MKLLIHSKLKRLHRWSLGMDKLYHPIPYGGCNYLSVLGLNLNHVSKRDHWPQPVMAAMKRAPSFKVNRRPPELPASHQVVLPFCMALDYLGKIHNMILIFLLFSDSEMTWGSENLCGRKGSVESCIVNTISADDLATLGARTYNIQCGAVITRSILFKIIITETP